MTSAAQPSVAATNSIPPVEQVRPHIKPEEISFPLPKSLYTTAHIHLTFLDTSVMVFLTTTTVGGNSAGSVKPMGSFVYAMPDRTSPGSTISTTLYSYPASVEYATRTAKILARRMGVPVYVGCSIDASGLGLIVEEEMDGFKKIVGVIMKRWEERERRE
ncbi:hypothetical protein MPDQ_002921 [Monascus purpureus]|uniref:Proteasome assembly chaperone 4 n=1 Tax=Monascus purpureus TaxID=5098 RepID=A0A507QJM9_MONPU|nr:hypothetical protein MPDQ_002921 [Monascus purpureus]BDD57255.1 hypothetical protein MAP00_002638 [Monascus purpureus]